MTLFDRSQTQSSVTFSLRKSHLHVDLVHVSVDGEGLVGGALSRTSQQSVLLPIIFLKACPPVPPKERMVGAWLGDRRN